MHGVRGLLCFVRMAELQDTILKYPSRGGRGIAGAAAARLGVSANLCRTRCHTAHGAALDVCQFAFVSRMHGYGKDTLGLR